MLVICHTNFKKKKKIVLGNKKDIKKYFDFLSFIAEL